MQKNEPLSELIHFGLTLPKEKIGAFTLNTEDLERFISEGRILFNSCKIAFDTGIRNLDLESFSKLNSLLEQVQRSAKILNLVEISSLAKELKTLVNFIEKGLLSISESGQLVGRSLKEIGSLYTSYERALRDNKTNYAFSTKLPQLLIDIRRAFLETVIPNQV